MGNDKRNARKGNIKGAEKLERIRKDLRSKDEILTCPFDLKPRIEVKEGTFIVVPVVFYSETKSRVFSPPTSPGKEKGTLIFKASLGKYLADTFVACDVKAKGIVCIYTGEINRSVIGFKVLHVAKDRKVCFVEAVHGSYKDLMSHYNTNTEVVLSNLNKLK